MNSTSFPFSIDSTTGLIRLQAPLDYEITRSYRFLIRASDSGIPKSLFSETWLSISIDDSNDSPIEILFVPNRKFLFQNETLFIEENLDVNNLTLGYFRLFDHDTINTNISFSLISNEKLQRQEYQLIPSNQPNTYLFIAKNGIFDREVQSEILLRFSATDQSLTSIYDLKIHLIDLNDNPGEFSSTIIRFYIEELANYQMIEQPTEESRVTIGYLNVTDRDEGINSLNIFTLEPNKWLQIDPDSGRLFLLQPIDREQISKIELKAKAINVAKPRWETDVKIEINV